MAVAMVSIVLEKVNSMKAAAALRKTSVVEQELEELSKNLGEIEAVVGDAELRQLKEQGVKVWLDKLKDAAYDLEDVLDEWEWNTTVRNFDASENFSEIHFIFNIRKLNERLDEIAILIEKLGLKKTSDSNPELIENLSKIGSEDTYVLENEKKSLLDMLSESTSDEEREVLRVISIVGMDDAERRELATFACNNLEVIKNFDLRIWVPVSGAFDESKIAKSIVEALGGSDSAFISKDLQLRWGYIRKSIVGQKFLLVLDNVLLEDYGKWEPLLRCLKNGLSGSKILVTTQKESVARMMKSAAIITPKKMSEEACWMFFKSIAFVGRSVEDCKSLEEIGRKIVSKCRRVPLAIKIIGSTLHFRKTKQEWQSISDSKVWELEELQAQNFVPLWLTYSDMPFMVRRCFLYCAIFPKGFRISKNELIKLWMAQGYLGRKVEEEMEGTGQNYFDQLVARSMFQVSEFEVDDDGSILRCKMHDLVHDFVQFLSMNECLSTEVKGDDKELWVHNFRHLFLMLNEGVSFPVSVSKDKNFRSLLIRHGVTNCSSISEVLPELISQSKSLRALDLSGQLWYEKVIIRIPREIGALILLSYLNLSSLKMAELPEDLCELYNLQTLELNWCTNLKRLPQGMGKLINLRHMLNVGTSLGYMPKEIERLTCLRTLSEFVVSSGGEAGTLKCLRSLNKLRGSLSIKNLGNVTDVNEVGDAKLESKLNLLGLSLSFENDDGKGGMMENEKVLEAMKPPEKLERLEIRDYKGNIMLPSWLMSLSNLRNLSLYDCINCKQLPNLGKLPSLESLSIYSMRSVKKVGKEFLGIQSGAGASSSSSSSAIPFSKLKSLKFVDMEEWKEWECGIKVMPRIRCLSLVCCPKLEALPDQILQAEMLQELNINWCPILKERYNRKTGGQDWLKFSRVPNIIINFAYLQRKQ